MLDKIVIKGVMEVKHAIPQRVRLKIKPLRFNNEAAEKLTQSVKNINGVTRYQANPKSASLIIRYNQEVITQEELIQAVKEFFVNTSEKKVVHGKRETKSIRYHAVRFVGLTVVTAAVFLTETVTAAAVAQSLFSPLGIITAIAALPLIKKTLDHAKERRFSLESFLGASILVACGAGEAAAALEILWITSGGQLLETWITEKSRRSIKDILEITAKNTYVLIDGVEVEIPVSQVQKGDTVVLHTGEKISVDGEIIKGEAVVDESSINGRSETIVRTKTDKVFAGTFVRQGVIFVKADKVGDKTYLARILTMVEDSMENRAPIEGVAEKLASNLIKAGFTVTLATYLGTLSLWRAFTVLLVMACPCATILSASTAISAAINAAAKRSILIKGGRYLEEVGKADIVCFDKTGTLTTNQPVIQEMINLSDLSDDEIIQLAYSAEMHNFHPIALALKKEAENRNVDPIVHEVCEYILGRGVRSEIHGKEILIGSRKMMEKFSIDITGINGDLGRFSKQGLTTIFIAKQGIIAAVFGFANQERPEIGQVVSYLQKNGITQTAMITGDEKATAINLASKLNMTKCYYSVMPEDKASIINELKNQNHKVIMVGDGINDALAIAEADIGIAMGAGGSAVAIEAADIAFVKDELNSILYVRCLSMQTTKVVHQNFWIATGSNAVGVVMAAMGILSPVAAGLIHITHTLGIMLNSSRLLAYNPNLQSIPDCNKPEQP
ncbi:MAG: cation-translocating P-type ATPase [Thermodesulfobacteriota bacterium]|nr:cation-translocating P-type ATPase [Thermodesulfobacteriota bacterium]